MISDQGLINSELQDINSEYNIVTRSRVREGRTRKVRGGEPEKGCLINTK